MQQLSRKAKRENLSNVEVLNNFCHTFCIHYYHFYPLSAHVTRFTGIADGGDGLGSAYQRFSVRDPLFIRFNSSYHCDTSL